MKVKEINIKDGMPPADVAVANMEIEIEALAHSEIKLLKVIHGYGSHGRGGEIKLLTRERLKILKSQGKILGYVEGEKFGKSAMEDFDIINNFPEIILQKDLFLNSGITLVFLK